MTPTRIRVPILLLAVAAAGVVGVLIACAVLAPRDEPTAQPTAVAAAKAEATAFFTLDYRRIDADLAAVQRGATGSFLAQYKAKAAQIRQGVVTGRLVSTASIAADSVAVEFEGLDRQIVLIGIDSTTTASASASAPASAAPATPTTNRYRMRVTVQQVGGRWLASSIEQVG